MKSSKDLTTIMSQISPNRDYLMGGAMGMVLIYHLLCWVHNPIGEFNIGYVGVDVFYFLSGFGLSYSYRKNSILGFYYNRIKRLLPLYWFAVAISFFLMLNSQTLFVLYSNLLTFGYYINNGVNRFDWYVESLFSIYLLFPIIYYLSRHWGG